MASEINAASEAAGKMKPKRVLTTGDIYERIYIAILEHRLRPGTKLVEERLADVFSVSRPKIRDVLGRLAHEQIVEMVPQRGAFVAKPSAQEAADVIEARKVIEPVLIRRLISTLTPEKIERMRGHLVREANAREADDKRAIIRLTGEFHILLSELAGNTALMRSMRELANLSCLITFLYNVPTAISCRHDEHAELVDAIAQSDLVRAESVMARHLDNIESALKLEEGEEELELAEIFGL